MKKIIFKLIAFGIISTSIMSFNPIKVQAEETSNMTIKEEVEKGILNKDNLKDYLNSLPALTTPIGKLKFVYEIDTNNSSLFPYDYCFMTSYGEITDSPYNLDLFDPYYLQYSINIKKEDKEKTIQQLKDYQTLIANIIIQVIPNKKIQGGFYKCGYKYPHIMEGFYKIQFFTWNNYIMDGMGVGYDHSQISSLHWDNSYDEYKF